MYRSITSQGPNLATGGHGKRLLETETLYKYRYKESCAHISVFGIASWALSGSGSIYFICKGVQQRSGDVEYVY